MFGGGIKPWEQREKGRVGTIGVSRGTGTTFSVLMMAYFTKHVLREKTAVVEKNLSGHLQGISEAEEIFCMKGIDIFGKGIYHGMEWKQTGYSRLFFDFGTCINEKGLGFTEFSNCTTKIVTASLCPWKRQELFQFVDKYSEIPGNEEWIYLIPFASQKAVKQAEKQLRRRMYAVEAEKEWYCMCIENLVTWKEILL